MSKLTSLMLAYDLHAPKGGHQEFKEAMIERNWRFAFGDTRLPNTTCFRLFPTGETRAQAFIQGQLKICIAEVQSKFPDLRLERFAFTVSGGENGTFGAYEL